MASRFAGRDDNADWLVGNPTRPHLASVLWIGSVGLLIVGLQPVLLGALFTESRLDLDRLALLATAEIIAIAIGSGVMAMLLSARQLRLKSAIFLALLALLNYATAIAEGPQSLLAVRILAGLAEGGMVAVATGLVARSRRAERIGGMFVTLQTTLQCLVALALALWVIPWAGSRGGFFVLSVISLASLLVVTFIPSRYEDLPKSVETLDGVLRLRSLGALAVIFFFFMFIGAIWAFLEPLGGQYGLDSKAIGVLVSACLAMQVLGAAMATWLEARLDYRVALVGVGIVAIIAAAILDSGPTPAMFQAAVLAIGFVWLFVIPYQIRLAIIADSTRATALLVPAAQLLSSALGPVAASLFIIGSDVRPVPEFAAFSVAVSLVLLGLLIATSRRGAAA